MKDAEERERQRVNTVVEEEQVISARRREEMEVMRRETLLVKQRSEESDRLLRTEMAAMQRRHCCEVLSNERCSHAFLYLFRDISASMVRPQAVTLVDIDPSTL